MIEFFQYLMAELKRTNMFTKFLLNLLFWNHDNVLSIDPEHFSRPGARQNLPYIDHNMIVSETNERPNIIRKNIIRNSLNFQFFKNILKIKKIKLVIFNNIIIFSNFLFKIYY